MPLALPKDFFAWTIIAISTLVWLAMIPPSFFGNEYLANFDHPMHQGLLSCAQKSSQWFLPSVWCDHLMAGVAPFQVYPAPFYLAVLGLANVFPLALAYKIALISILALIPLAVGLTLFLSGRRLAGAMTYALLLLDPYHIHLVITNGSFFNQVSGIAFFIASVAAFVSFMEQPTPYRFRWWCLLSAASLVFHPTTFLFMPIPLLLVTCHSRQSGRMILWSLTLWAVLISLLSSWWLVPFARSYAEGFFNPPGGNEPLLELILPIISLLHPALIAAGGVGIGYLAVKEPYPFTLIPSIAIAALVLIGFNSLLPWRILHVMEAPSLIHFLRMLLVVSASMLFSAVLDGRVTHTNRSMNLFLKIGVFAVFSFLFVSLAFASHNLLKSAYLLELPGPLSYELSRLPSMEGRFLVEETLGQSFSTLPNTSSLWGFGPLLTTPPLISPWISHPRFSHGETSGGRLLGLPVYFMEQHDRKKILEALNIEYILGSSRDYKLSFNFLEPNREFLGMTLWRNNATSLGWFKTTTGLIISEKYHDSQSSATVISPGPTRVIFKMRYWQNWKATVDGIHVKILKGEGDLMEVPVPGGTHTVQFEYRMIKTDWLGLVLSVLGVILILSVPLYSHRFFLTSTPRPST